MYRFCSVCTREVGEYSDRLLESEQAVFQELSRETAPVCLDPAGAENPHGLVTLWDMLQIYAHVILKLFDELRDLEIQVGMQLPQAPPAAEAKAVSDRFLQHLGEMRAMCEVLQLSSAQKQVLHIIDFIDNKITPGAQVSPKLTELRRRIREDLEDHVYFCVPGREAYRCFTRNEKGAYQFKVPSELMDSSIVERFPSASDDIDGAYRCFILNCYPASMFHLMRVVEIGVLKLAKVADLRDPSPSWGAVLKHIEKIVLRTKYEDVDPSVQPHRKLLESVLPQMQAIQRAWRNKFAHIEDKIIPADSTITEPIANEILVAVEAFMRQLAIDLPSEV